PLFYTDMFQAEGEFQDLCYSPSILIHDNINLNEKNDTLSLSNPNDQREIENTMFEAIINYNNSNDSDDFNGTNDSDDSADSDNSNNSDDSRAIIWPITSGASFLSWISLEKVLNIMEKKTDNETGNISRWCFVCEYLGDPKPKHTTDHTQAQQTYSKKNQISMAMQCWL
ncbi:26296_t:CDS:2, partial [Gigaspora margarita]